MRGGGADVAASERVPSPKGNHKSKQNLLKEENEGLKEQLMELQAEYDHYKLTKSKQVEELTDQVEKLHEVE